MTSLDVFIQALISGVLAGGVYALVAIGLTLVFGVMRVVNFAHGDFMMVAMYGAFFSWTIFGSDPLLSTLWLVPSMGLLGAALYHFVIRRLVGLSELSSMAVTMGVALLLQNLALMTFKADNLVVDTSWSSKAILIGNISIQLPHLVSAAASAILIVSLYLLLRFTDLGLKMRAVSQSPEGAALSGIDLHRVALVATVIGIGTLGVAGPLLTPMLYVNPLVGAQFTLIAFVVVIAGGLGNFPGAIVAGLLVGVAERVSSVWLSASLSAAVPFVILVAVMLLRPQGLLVKAK